jgi:hypothetical protein
MFENHMGPPYQYQQMPPQAPNYPTHPMPSTSSAFYPPQQVHRDLGESFGFFLGNLIDLIELKARGIRKRDCGVY